MVKTRNTIGIAAVLLSSLVISESVYGFNTVETYNRINDYFIINMGVRDMGPGDQGPKTYGSATLGKGFSSFLTGYMGVYVAGNKYFSGGSGGFFLGSMAGLYSYNHFALDVTLEAGLFDYYFYATPGIEVNYDLAPDQQFMGFYLNAGQQFTGRDTSWDEDDTTTLHVDESAPKHVLAPETELKIGFYYSFYPGQQIHVRFDQRFRNKPLFDENVYEIDALRVGYNVLVLDGLQVQMEVNYRFPQYGNNSRFGLGIGLVRW